MLNTGPPNSQTPVEMLRCGRTLDCQRTTLARSELHKLPARSETERVVVCVSQHNEASEQLEKT